ncbi:hypothetical protein IMCC21224_111216 [Puniceibacterium sp. IMCC21224]|nr:DUF4864 domain-containing protein [Puniceibacterium sp. IMCC21224]KMK66366.1 hypothetical protein IMCC21224_111216 [Puniceibacterium sp. IMCC21224]
MRGFMIGLIMAALFSGAALAQTSDNAEIQGTIRSQIDAFLADDLDRAFGYASPTIQGLFGSAGNFGKMVQQGYPMVWRPDDVRFGSLRQIEGNMWQQVIVRDGQGMTHVLDYQMVMQDGEWRIGGVQILQQPEVSA